MTKDTLTLGSTDLSEHCESITVDYKQLDWHHAPDPTVRPEHRDLTSSEPYKHSYTYDYLSLSRTVVIPNCRCSVINIKDLIKRALRTYPKRMSRAKRKEARARERRRVERHNQWWSNR